MATYDNENDPVFNPLEDIPLFLEIGNLEHELNQLNQPANESLRRRIGAIITEFGRTAQYNPFYPRTWGS